MGIMVKTRREENKAISAAWYRSLFLSLFLIFAAGTAIAGMPFQGDTVYFGGGGAIFTFGPVYSSPGLSNYPRALSECQGIIFETPPIDTTGCYVVEANQANPGQFHPELFLPNDPPPPLNIYNVPIIRRLNYYADGSIDGQEFAWLNPEFCQADQVRDLTTGVCITPPPPIKDAGKPSDDPADGEPDSDPIPNPEPDPGSDPDTNPGPPPGPSPLACASDDGKMTGFPCNTATGNKYLFQTDYRGGPGALSFTRFYNSQVNKDLGLGFGWSAPFYAQLEVSGTTILVRRPNGRGESFMKDSAGNWQGDADTKLILTQDPNGYRLALRTGAIERYGATGLLSSVTTAQGRTTSYSYDTAGKLTAVTGPFGHTLSFGYDASHLTSLTDPAGKIITYGYDANNNLALVTYPDGTSKRYHYENASFPHHLTGISDENEVRFATYAYDTTGKVSSTERATTSNGGAQQRLTFSFDSDTQTTVTDAVGASWVLTFQKQLGVKNLVRRVNQQDGKAVILAYDSQNNLIRYTNEEGQTTSFGYNGSNQKLSQTEALGAPEERTTTYQYLSPTLSLPTLIQSPSVYAGHQKQTGITYQNNNPVTITQSGYTPDGTPVSRTLALQYNAAGQVISLDGPRTDVADVTTFEYYDCTTGAECGQLKSITNALGQRTTYDSYNAKGKLTQATDANGLVTQYAYDDRGRVTDIAQTPPAGTPRTAHYTYNAGGQLIQVRYPDGGSLSYIYDDAHFLRSITDVLGDKIEYRYDLKGNRLENLVKDPDGTLVRSLTAAYNVRNQLTSFNAGGSLTQQVHDAIGNLTSETDPNNANASSPVTTNYSYDALNRLIQIFDRLGGPAAFNYDVNDRPIQVTPSNGISTRDVYDDLGNLLQEQSPTRGQTAYTYNDAGQVTSRTDADNFSVTYSYDAVGRLTGIDYPGTDDDISYQYDSAPGCTHGIGRLCQAVDASGVTRYAYDAFGNLTKETKTELSVAYTTQYSYDAQNRITSLTYPDGRTMTYTRNPTGRVTDIAMTNGGTTTSLLSAVTTRADGLITAQTFGNGLTETRGYDLQGRLTSQTLGGESRRYTYDANGNLMTLPPSSYNYDLIDRLVQATLGTDSFSYVYEGNGDLLYKTSTPPNPSPRDDAFSYNAPGQLTEYRQGGAIKGSYVYDHRNLRTRKNDTRGTTVYHYDQGGQLIAETQPDGTLIRAYVWLNTTPIVQTDNNNSTETITYLHTDHLNTPRFATNAQGTKIWSWNSEGFGNSAPNEDVDQDSNLTTINLRFPGQYYDQESGLHYNWNRYYDPRTGRYVTSDPIGFEGGLNTYAYVDSVGEPFAPELNTYLYAHANPLRFIDPKGLSSIVYNGGSGSINIYSGSGQLIGTFPASNNAASNSAGPWSSGTYNFSHYSPHPGSGPNDPFGSNGNFVFNVPGRSGMGVHSGMANSCDLAGHCGSNYATEGCIRTTDQATGTLRQLQQGGDPLTSITVNQ